MVQTIESSKFKKKKSGTASDPIMKVHSGLSVEEFSP